MLRILIFANGELTHPDKICMLVDEQDLLIAADGGTRHVLALGLQPDLIIGDLDSLAMEKLPGNIPVQKFPADKNETDLELALKHACSLNPTQIIIIGALGGRLDHSLGNISLLTDIGFSAFDIRMEDGVEEILVCRSQVRVHGRSGDLVSLIPWGGEASGVSTEHLRWPLHGDTLFPGRTRGISNEMLDGEASIKLDAGLLLVIHRRSS
jgi:thiamine pyrophosphokinase